MILFADSETFSSVPIRNGVSAYAAADDFEVMVLQYAVDDGPVTVLDLTAGDSLDEFLSLVPQAEHVVFHNSFFDRTVLREDGIVTLKPEQIHDTMVNALCHGLPGGLDKLCSIFKVPTDLAKDKRGKELIQLFCKPRPKNMKLRRATRDTHPVEWQQFLDYAGSDILAMRDIYRKMPRWSFFDNPTEFAVWCIDQRANDRGFQVDMDFARAAVDAVTEEKLRLKDRASEMTDGEVESATKRDQVLRWALEQHGVKLPDLRAGTIERRLEDDSIPEPLKDLLRVRLSAAGAATAKYKKVLEVVSPDGRIRGGLQFSGAARTQRWSGRLFQPQNLVRPPEGFDVNGLILATLRGWDTLVLISADINAELAYCCRGLIIAAKGRKLVTSDLKNIEGRVLAWLSNETWKLDYFRDYDEGKAADLYKVTYSRCFDVPLEEVTKDQRQSGKVAELACGYQGAVGAFSSMAMSLGIEDFPEDQIVRVVKAYRAANENIRTFWKDLEDACREAILNPGLEVHCRRVSFIKQGAWLRIKLPGGGSLSYARPKVGDDGKTITYWGLNSYTRRWEEIATYGGKLAENITQRVARDIIAYALPSIEAAGFLLVLTVHDEIICEAPDEPRYSVDLLSRLMCAARDWPGFDELPLAADGFEAYRYRK